MNLNKNVHLNLKIPENVVKQSLVKGNYIYYHYGCDQIDDRGWGCGYRTLQTLCSWIQEHPEVTCKDLKDGIATCSNEVPSIKAIQEALVAIGDKSLAFINSRQWIGSVEIALCLDHFYGVSCRIIHVKNGLKLKEHFNALENHFDIFGSPVMMGGNNDASSKGLLGVCRNSEDIYFLVLDPHYTGSTLSKEILQNDGWVKWQPLSYFSESSFYNICCPLLKICSN